MKTLERKEEETKAPKAMSDAGRPRGGRAPGPSDWSMLRNISRFRKAPLDTITGTWQTYGDIYSVRMGPLTFTMVHRPEYIQHVLQTNAANYVKSPFYDNLKLLLGNGLVTSEGDFWRRQRRLSQPAFKRSRTAGFLGLFHEQAMVTRERWHALARAGEAVDVCEDMMDLTLRIVGHALFSTDLSSQANSLGEPTKIALREITNRQVALFRPPLSWPTRRNRRLRGAIESINAVVGEIIRERRALIETAGGMPGAMASGKVPHDLLSLLLAARDEETNEQMTDRQVRDEVMTFLMAGHETTSNALTWTFYLLARHPEIAAKAREECRGLSGDVPEADEIMGLEYTRMVLEESMRIFPPVWGMDRQALDEDEIGGYRVPKKGIVGMTQWVMHRHPDYWDNPLEFRPERFSPENSAGRPRFAYFPFGGGQRQCIGMDFAMMEALAILAVLLRDFHAELVSEERPFAEALVTLRPRDGLMMRPRVV